MISHKLDRTGAHIFEAGHSAGYWSHPKLNHYRYGSADWHLYEAGYQLGQRLAADEQESQS